MLCVHILLHKRIDAAQGGSNCGKGDAAKGSNRAGNMGSAGGGMAMGGGPGAGHNDHDHAA